MRNSRRNFLVGGCALAAFTAVAPLAGSSLTRQQIQGRSLALLHDESQCIGCDACSQACRETNQVPQSVSRLSIRRTGPYGSGDAPFYRFERVSCQHCENAPCVRVCPTGAAYRDPNTGIVAVDEFKCVGCQYCIAACPYQVRYVDPQTKAVDKCDFCQKSRLEKGLQPACVDACPTKALVFGDLNDPHSTLVQRLKVTPTYRDKESLGTRPKVFRVSAKPGEIRL
ncbi:4Fe-4S dicluster domain-containing protein [Paraferrimonas sedimenticola]|uniref:4Fe-4S dicluster domain-containing protein n=1 Tax=Paraferrimonas sedimenticola TaxID=375674 RepID=UPI000BA9CF5D|nr:4Fe-4S dicluster domain-containing protein [Paraferrimonas sedimenticola]